MYCALDRININMYSLKKVFKLYYLGKGGKELKKNEESIFS